MIAQTIIVICGLATVLLSQDTDPRRRRWACLIGIFAQPFWFYAAWSAEQWGILALTGVYTAGWCRGVYNFWIRKAAA